MFKTMHKFATKGEVIESRMTMDATTHAQVVRSDSGGEYVRNAPNTRTAVNAIISLSLDDNEELLLSRVRQRYRRSLNPMKDMSLRWIGFKINSFQNTIV